MMGQFSSKGSEPYKSLVNLRHDSSVQICVSQCANLISLESSCTKYTVGPSGSDHNLVSNREALRQKLFVPSMATSGKLGRQAGCKPSS